jgi:hypothetical protein
MTVKYRCLPRAEDLLHQVKSQIAMPINWSVEFVRQFLAPYQLLFDSRGVDGLALHLQLLPYVLQQLAIARFTADGDVFLGLRCVVAALWCSHKLMQSHQYPFTADCLQLASNIMQEQLDLALPALNSVEDCYSAVAQCSLLAEESDSRRQDVIHIVFLWLRYSGRFHESVCMCRTASFANNAFDLRWNSSSLQL